MKLLRTHKFKNNLSIKKKKLKFFLLNNTVLFKNLKSNNNEGNNSVNVIFNYKQST